MNFYGHAVVAALSRSEPGFVLGAMLPDFEGMARARIGAVEDASVRDGIACHHAADEAFHGAAAFVQSCSVSVAMLTERGMPRGPARAIAHVGLELVLDGFLVRTYGPSPMYLDALHTGMRLLSDGSLAPRDLERTPALEGMLERLIAYGAPRSEEPAEHVTERLVRMLRARPRLAIPESLVGEVTEHVEHLTRAMPVLGPELLRAASSHSPRSHR